MVEESFYVKHAKEELDYMAKVFPDAFVLNFREQIMNMVVAIANSEHSVKLRPKGVNAITATLNNILKGEPVTDLTGEDSEWMQVGGDERGAIYQNVRKAGLFKQGATAWYMDAVVFKDKNGSLFTSSGRAKTLAGQVLNSKLVVKSFPFKPRTFIIDVVLTDKKDWLITNSKQLEEVWKVYKKPADFETIKR